jgi:hypothetical protein
MTAPDDTHVHGSFAITDNPSPDKEHDDFFKWIGICIKQWALIERELFELCSLVLKVDTKYVSIIYYRTPSVEGRISLTDDLLKALWPKTSGEHDAAELRSWKELRNTIRGLLAVRNLIAHAPISYHLAVAVETDQKVGDVQVAQGFRQTLFREPVAFAKVV